MTIRNKINGLLHHGFRRFFMTAESWLGLHVTRAHFYSPIPTVGELKPEVYSRISDCPGMEFNAPGQLDLLTMVYRKYLQEYSPQPNSGLARADAFVLYALVREKKPRCMIEIGSGESTRITLAALRKNDEEGFPCRFTAIEPFPKDYLRKLTDKNFVLIDKKIQDVDVGFFLDADILFIDSSHVSRIGSDVNYEVLEIVPRLKMGALVHWHDIMIPTDYPRAWIESTNQFWNESYLVHAFLLNNRAFAVRWASKFMQLSHPRELHATFPFFFPDDPNEQLSSLWVERVI